MGKRLKRHDLIDLGAFAERNESGGEASSCAVEGKAVDFYLHGVMIHNLPTAHYMSVSVSVSVVGSIHASDGPVWA